MRQLYGEKSMRWGTSNKRRAETVTKPLEKGKSEHSGRPPNKAPPKKNQPLLPKKRQGIKRPPKGGSRDDREKKESPGKGKS